MPRILLVDDEQSVLISLGTLLRVEGYEVRGSQGGQEAISLLRSGEPFDLMISDVRMNPVDGLELLMLAREVRPQMAVLLVTAYDSPEIAAGALRMGAFAYLAKPFKIDELLAQIRKAMGARAAQPPA